MLKGCRYVLPGSMLGPEVNAGIDAGPIQKMCGADSMPGPDFGGNLTSLARMVIEFFKKKKRVLEEA